MSTGIRKRGSSYEASVWVARDNKRLRKSFANLKEATAWRATTTDRVNAGTVRASSSTTLRQAWNEWLEGAESGLMADELYQEGLDPSTIRNALMPVRALYRRLLQRGQLAVNPTTALALPAVRGSRDRIVSPEEAARLLAALPEGQRPLWATALYAGLRRGELMALRFEDVDFDQGLIRVERSYDPRSHGFVEPKSRSGRRVVPMASVLRQYLAQAKLSRVDRTGLIFSEDGEHVFDDRKVALQAQACWRKHKLEQVTLHECRHTFASLMIRAGVKRQGAGHLHGPRVDHDHARPLRPPAPRERERGRWPPRRVSRKRRSHRTKEDQRKPVRLVNVPMGAGEVLTDSFPPERHSSPGPFFFSPNGPTHD
jgi:integrase